MMKMYRVSTSRNLKVEVLTVKRIHRGTVVYMDSNGTEYKEDLTGSHINWFDKHYEVQGFINKNYYKEEKLARDKQIALTNMLRSIGDLND